MGRQKLPNPNKWQLRERAQAAVRAAIRTGKLPDGSEGKCEICGYDGSLLINSRLIAHHDDYNKPLEIKWICRSCNTKIRNPRVRTSVTLRK